MMFPQESQRARIRSSPAVSVDESETLGSSPPRRMVTAVLALAALLGILGYLWLQRHELSSIRLVAPGYLGLCVTGMLGNISANGLMFYFVFHRLGARVSFWESASLTTLSIAANLFLPLRGGAGLRAVYLKRVHGLRYTRFAASLLIFYVLSVIVASLGALIAASWMVIVEGRKEMLPVVIVAALCLVGAGATKYLPRFRQRGGWLGDKLADISDGWRAMSESFGFLARVLPVSALQTVSLLLSLWGAAAAIGVLLAPAEIVVVGTLGVLSTLISLTPGSLGIYEATVGLAASAVGMGGTEGVIAALVSRSVLMAILIVLGPIAMIVLRHARRPSAW